MLNKVLIHPSYFPSISHYALICQTEELIFEQYDHFQKQTNRNRCYIYGANGKMILTIPVKKQRNSQHQLYKDCQIDYSFHWQKNHFKSIESAYRTSPFFEFYEDQFIELFQKKTKFLIDLNYDTIELLNKCIGITSKSSKTTSFEKTINNRIDFRFLIEGKTDTFQNKPYLQVFDQKHGFIPTLSVLDLLFNQGNLTKDYLINQPLDHLLTL